MVRVTRNLLILFAFILCGTPALTFAKPNLELNNEIQKATDTFKQEVKTGDSIISSAKGYLIFPEVTKAGIGIGGEYGKGALVVDGEIKEYYSTKSASIGAQLGVQTKSMIIAFMTDEALENFEKSNGWEVGVDGSVAIAKIGAEGSIDTTSTLNKSVVAYIFGQSGLMADVSISGSKISKLES
ncbi:MAG: lipid-binding SYLF domain-containing protein [Bdellovibrionales bacterium]|nr:lipid-binding SYLF domain-containing protein [Bdellovibrionales bacterium]